MAEALLNHWGRGRFRALSAGWEPAAGVHELTARVLRRAQLLPAVLKPRGWSELAGEEGPRSGSWSCSATSCPSATCSG
jgi:arsenate reductase